MKLKHLQIYSSKRDALLEQIITFLKTDPRFVAAWLTGSFGRNESDDISDLDLNIVVRDDAVETLCARPWESGGRTTPERHALISRFGQPGILFEAHQNAPPGGCFTTVFYQETALCVDWILIPQSKVERPLISRLLFQKTIIPLSSPPKPENLDARMTQASHEIAYFWLMAAAMIKYIIRQDSLQFNSWLDILHEIAINVEQLMTGEASIYHPNSLFDIKLGPDEQETALRQLCQKMLNLMPQVEEMGGTVPENPMTVINKRLDLIPNNHLT